MYKSKFVRPNMFNLCVHGNGSGQAGGPGRLADLSTYPTYPPWPAELIGRDLPTYPYTFMRL